MSKFLKFIVNVFLVISIFTAAAILLPPVLGVNTTIVDSAGMDTNLPLGSVTYSVDVPVTKLKPGAEVLKENGSSTYAYIIEKGDVATGKYKVASAVDRDSVTEITLRNTVSLVKLSIPYIGYVVVAMQTIEGIIIIVLVVLFIIILFVLSELWKPRDDDDDDDTEGSDDILMTPPDPEEIDENDPDAGYSVYKPEQPEDDPIEIFDSYEVKADDAGMFESSPVKEDAVPDQSVYQGLEAEAEMRTFDKKPAESFAVDMNENVQIPEFMENGAAEAETVSGQADGFAAEQEQMPETGYEPQILDAGQDVPYMDSEAAEEIEQTQPGPEAEEHPEFEQSYRQDETSDDVDLGIRDMTAEDIPVGGSEMAYEDERADYLEPNQFVAVDRLSLEQILEQSRRKGTEPEVNKDEVSGVNVVDYSKLL